jgi:hypothetical protein
MLNYLSSTCGVQTTIIDFGLSRLDLGAKQIHAALPEDVYEGVGAQWNVYRGIRDLVKGDWKGYHPETNVMVSRHLPTSSITLACQLFETRGTILLWRTEVFISIFVTRL